MTTQTEVSDICWDLSDFPLPMPLTDTPRPTPSLPPVISPLSLCPPTVDELPQGQRRTFSPLGHCDIKIVVQCRLLSNALFFVTKSS